MLVGRGREARRRNVQAGAVPRGRITRPGGWRPAPLAADVRGDRILVRAPKHGALRRAILPGGRRRVVGLAIGDVGGDFAQLPSSPGLGSPACRRSDG